VKRLRVAAEVPAECPRARGVDGDGPRCCAFTGCRFHRLRPPERGPWTPPRLRPGDDTCALDRSTRGAMSRREVAVFFGVSEAAIKKVAAGALRKLALELQVSDHLLTRYLRGG
jgi:hypothetical protein